MRLLVLLLLLPALPARAAGPGSCPWTEPASPPKLEVLEGTARFSWPLAEDWFSCARARGGSMEVQFVLRGPKGTVTKAKQFTRTKAAASETIALPDLCSAGVAGEAQVRVVGTGPMDRLLFETPFVPVPCFSCARPGRSELAVAMSDPDAPAGFVLVKGRWDAPFETCAKAAGGTLSLRVYVGDSQLEAGTRRDHSFVLHGLEKDAAFRRAFAPTNLCAEGKWIGVEYFGTGEFRQLNLVRRETLALICPKPL